MKISGRVFNLTGSRSQQRTYATWSPSDKAGGITLSNGNLTAAASSSSTYSEVRATLGKSSGKWYWEITCVGDQTAGIALLGASLSDGLGAGIADYGWMAAHGTYNGIYHGNVKIVASSTTDIAAGTVIGVALDCDNNTLILYANNVQAVTTSIVSGTWFPSTGQIYNQSSFVTASANFGATPLVYTPPAGYMPGLFIDI